VLSPGTAIDMVLIPDSASEDMSTGMYGRAVEARISDTCCRGQEESFWQWTFSSGGARIELVNIVSNRFIEFSSLPRVAKSTGRAERCALVIVGVTKGIICSDDNATSAELYLYLRCTKQKSEWGEMGHSKRCEGQQGKKDSLDRI